MFCKENKTQSNTQTNKEERNNFPHTLQNEKQNKKPEKKFFIDYLFFWLLQWWCKSGVQYYTTLVMYHFQTKMKKCSSEGDLTAPSPKNDDNSELKQAFLRIKKTSNTGLDDTDNKSDGEL